MSNAVQKIKDSLNETNVKMLLEKTGATHITSSGSELRSTCPLHHGDNQTAFAWNLDKNLWYCFTSDCGGGDVFDFVADYYNLSIEHDFIEIINKTAELLEIDISGLEYGERASQHKKELQAWLEYVNHKHNTNCAFDMRTLGAMYPINSYRQFDAALLKRFGVSYNKPYNRIAVPVYDENSVLVGATMRRCDETEKIKWLHRPKHILTGSLLYNLNNIKEKFDAVYITEGTIDVWNLVKLGKENSVATFGANLTEDQMYLIIKYFTDVILAYDSDDKGDKGTKKAIEMLKNKVNLGILDLGAIHDAGTIPDRDTLDNLRIKRYWEVL